MEYLFREILCSKALQVKTTYYEANGPGKVMALMTNDVTSLRVALGLGVMIIVDIIFYSIVGSIILIQKINNIIKYRKNSLMEYDSGNEIENTDYNKGGNQFYEKLIGLIHDNISNSEFGITNICEELNISRTQLYRKVKAVTDIPISTLIRNLRMEKAYELFKNNDYTVSEVMYQVGINSNSYFTKTFKEYFNILPSEFIKQTYKK